MNFFFWVKPTAAAAAAKKKNENFANYNLAIVNESVKDSLRQCSENKINDFIRCHLFHLIETHL